MEKHGWHLWLAGRCLLKAFKSFWRAFGLAALVDSPTWWTKRAKLAEPAALPIQGMLGSVHLEH